MFKVRKQKLNHNNITRSNVTALAEKVEAHKETVKELEIKLKFSKDEADKMSLENAQLQINLEKCRLLTEKQNSVIARLQTVVEKSVLMLEKQKKNTSG